MYIDTRRGREIGGLSTSEEIKKKKKLIGSPVRRYIEGIVSYEAHRRPVQSEPLTPHRGGKDESGEKGADHGIDETPEHLMRTVWHRLSLQKRASSMSVMQRQSAAQMGTRLGEYSGGLGANS